MKTNAKPNELGNDVSGIKSLKLNSNYIYIYMYILVYRSHKANKHAHTWGQQIQMSQKRDLTFCFNLFVCSLIYAKRNMRIIVG